MLEKAAEFAPNNLEGSFRDVRPNTFMKGLQPLFQSRVTHDAGITRWKIPARSHDTIKPHLPQSDKM